MQSKSTFVRLKTITKKLLFVAMLLLFVSGSSFSQILINEGFNTVLPTGWARQNLGTPAGTNPNWGQGNAAVFAANSGAPTAYAFANFQSVTGTNTISNWLFTPEVAIANGNVLTFFTRVPTGGNAFPDRLQVRMSTAGASTNAGASNTSVGDFTVVLQDINPTYGTSYPETWTQFTITISGVAAPTTGRFAFRHFVENGGPTGDNSNYIGLDDVLYSTPCSGPQALGNTLSTAANICPGINFTLSTQTIGLSNTTYQWQVSTDGGTTWTNIAGASGTTLVRNQTVTSQYRLQATCGAAVSTSTPVTVTLNPPLACYCIPGTSDCTDDDVLLNVTFGTINNTTTCSANGYGDFFSSVAPANVEAGSNMPISVRVPTTFSEQVSVWIDYNKNAVFEPNEYTHLGSNAAGGTINAIIPVPATAQLGATRMRVRVRFATALTSGQACTTYGFGETEDYQVNITPCIVMNLTSQPTDRSVACGGNTSFAVTATGTAPVYQWQFRTSATALWQNVTNGGVYSGATAATLNLAFVPISMTGYQYRVVYSGGCRATDFSNIATLTVTPMMATINPAGSIVRCSSSTTPTAISVTNVPAPVTVSFNSTGSVNIPDATGAAAQSPITASGIPTNAVISEIRATFNITHTWVGDLDINLVAPNGTSLNLVGALNGGTGSNGTANFTGTAVSSNGVNALSGAPAPRTGVFRADRITGYGPVGFEQAAGTNWSNLQSTMNGNWRLVAGDYGALDVGTITSWTLTIEYGAPANGVFTPTTGLYTDAAATVPYDGSSINTVYAMPAASTTYSLVVTTVTCVSDTLRIPVAVHNPLTGTSAVTSQATCVGGNASFTATVPANVVGVAHAWQFSTNGGATWSAVTNTGVYSGATTSMLTISGAPITMNGYRYRDSLYVTACSTNIVSSAGVLTVNPNPVIVLSANPYTALFPGLTTTLAAAVSPNAASTYTWYAGGVPVTGTANTLPLTVDQLGTYSVEVEDINGCMGSSNSIVIKDSVSDILYVYPSPSNGPFNVRYYSNTTGARSLNVYDNKGARIYTKLYTITGPYTNMPVEIPNLSRGIYSVELADRNGKRIKTGRVLIQ